MKAAFFHLLKNERLKTFAFLALIVIAIAFMYFIDPVKSSVFPPCPFYLITGLYCPGCGSSRSIHQLLHGHLLIGFKLNPLMVLSLPFLIYSFISRAVFAIQGKPYTEIFIPAIWIWILLGLIITFWIVRNTSFYPFLSFMKNFKG